MIYTYQCPEDLRDSLEFPLWDYNDITGEARWKSADGEHTERSYFKPERMMSAGWTLVDPELHIDIEL